jgi:DNA polymerase-1
MIALIDADSILYVLGYNYREHINEPSADIDISRAADDFVKTILTIVQADYYVGAFSPDKNFRHSIYKYARYKGERAEKPDWFLRFAPVIKKRLEDKWGFFTVPDLEADDIVCVLAEHYSNKEMDWIICSPDKDLRQIAGLHYDYKKEGATIEMVTTIQAQKNFWTQMLCGDTTDNVKGVPGLGEKKVAVLLKECEELMHWEHMVLSQYIKYFGDYYGVLIFHETKDTLQLMSSRHRLWPMARNDLERAEIWAKLNILGTTTESPFDQLADTIESVLDQDLINPFCPADRVSGTYL